MAFCDWLTGETHKLSSLHTILSTGSPLKPQSFDYVYRDIKQELLLGSITGECHMTYPPPYVHFSTGQEQFLLAIGQRASVKSSPGGVGTGSASQEGVSPLF